MLKQTLQNHIHIWHINLSLMAFIHNIYIFNMNFLAVNLQPPAEDQFLNQLEHQENTTNEMSMNNLAPPPLIFQQTFQIRSDKEECLKDPFFDALHQTIIDDANCFLNLGKATKQDETRIDDQPKLLSPFIHDNQNSGEMSFENPELTRNEGVVNQNQQSGMIPQNPEPIRVTYQPRGRDLSNQKKEETKNIPRYTLKFAIKQYAKPAYKAIVAKIHLLLGIKDSQAAIRHYTQRRNWDFNLQDLRVELNYEIGSETERVYKEAFLVFYRWLMRNIYPIYVLTSKKIQNKIGYFRRKNELIHLPDTEKKTKRIRKDVRTEPRVSVSDQSEEVIKDFELLRLSTPRRSEESE